MSGTTRTIQQPVATGSVLSALGMAAAVLAAAVAISWGAANLGAATTVAKPASGLFAPIVRDLGARDPAGAANGLAPNIVNDHGSSGASIRTRVLGNQLKDDAYVAPADTSTPVVGPRGPIGYHGSDAVSPATTQPLGYHGFGNGAPTTSGSNDGASGRSLAPRAQ